MTAEPRTDLSLVGNLDKAIAMIDDPAEFTATDWRYRQGWIDGLRAVRDDPAITAADSALREVAEIVSRHTHQQGMYAMTRHAGEAPERDCLLCRALVAAGVLTLDQIGAGTRAALLEANHDR